MARRKGKGRKGGLWLQKARQSMERRGTVGKFGRATASKIAAGKRKGGKEAKRAVFSENMKRLAQKRKKRGRKSSGRS
jgi:hypothetical protein